MQWKEYIIHKKSENIVLRNKFWFFFGAFILAVIISVAIIGFAWKRHQSFKQAVISQAQQQMLSTAKATALQIENFLHDITRMLKTGAEIIQVQSVAQANGRLSFKPGAEEYYPFDSIYKNFDKKIDLFYLLNADGANVDRIPFIQEKIGANRSGRPGVEYVKKNHTPYVSNMFTTAANKSSISITHPIFKADDFVGMFRAVMYTQNLYKHFLQTVRIGENGYIFLLDNEGDIYYHPNSDFIGENIVILSKKMQGDAEGIETEILQKILSGSESASVFVFDELLNERASYAWTYIATNPKAMGTAGIKIKYHTGVSRDILEQRAVVIGKELDKAIVRPVDLIDTGNVRKVLQSLKIKYSDIIEMTIHAPRSMDDNTLIYKISTSPGLTGKSSDPEDIKAVEDDKLSIQFIKQPEGRPFAGTDVVDVTIPIHTSETFWPVVAIMPFSEIIEPIDQDAKSTFGFAGLLLVTFCALGIGFYKTQEKSAHLEAEKDHLQLIASSAKMLRKSEEKYRTLFNSAHDAIFIHDMTTRFIEVNDIACKQLGYTKQEMLNMTVPEIDLPEFADKVPERIRQLKEAGHVVFESAHVSRDKKVIPVEINSRLIEYDGKPAVFSIARDLTERKLAEETQQESERIIRLIIKAAHDAIIMINNDGNVIYWNKSAEKLFGYKEDEMIDMNLLSTIIPKKFHGKYFKAYDEFDEESADDGIGKTVELMAVKKNKEEFPVELSISAVKTKSYWNIIWIVRDITRRKEEEAEKRKDYLNSVGIIVVAIDKDGTLSFINKAGCEIFGYGEDYMTGKDFFEHFLPKRVRSDARNVLAQLMEGRTKGLEHYECPIVIKGGEERDIYWTNSLIRDEEGNIISALGAGEDITQKKLAEEEKQKLWNQLVQAQKMESIGRLTGGISHDFNNLLTAILGYSDLALQDLPKDHPAAKKIKAVLKGGKKASRLTRQLLAFSRRQVLNMELNNLNNIIRDTSNLLTRVIREDIEIEILPDVNTSNVIVDETQIEQVLMNLVMNASHAMPDGGKLTISTDNVAVDEEFIKTHQGLSTGSFVRLSVSDTGTGMSDDVIEKIFEPFFTTKEKGEGTGLGLSTVFGIVKQHEGYIHVDSEVGKGTTFSVYFPAAIGDIEDEAADETEVMKKCTETLLIVDDDRIILDLMIQTLKPLGFQALFASNGAEAIEISDNTQGKIDLLVTDVVMPGMSGWELAETIRESRPDIKLIFSSGYLDSPTVLNHIMEKGLTFLSKPFTPRSLAAMVQKVLGRGKEMKTDA